MCVYSKQPPHTEATDWLVKRKQIKLMTTIDTRWYLFGTVVGTSHGKKLKSHVNRRAK